MEKAVVVPKFLADWFERDLTVDFDYGVWAYLTSWEDQPRDELYKWFNTDRNCLETLVAMEKHGYVVREEDKEKDLGETPKGSLPENFYISFKKLCEELDEANRLDDELMEEILKISATDIRVLDVANSFAMIAFRLKELIHEIFKHDSEATKFLEMVQENLPED